MALAGAPDAQLELRAPSDCAVPGVTLDVEIHIGALKRDVVGAQLFIHYDPDVLAFEELELYEPLTELIFLEIDENTGDIGLATHVPVEELPGGLDGPAALGRLSFVPRAGLCDPTAVVWRDERSPAVRLTQIGGAEVLPELVDTTVALREPAVIALCPPDTTVQSIGSDTATPVSWEPVDVAGSCSGPPTIVCAAQPQGAGSPIEVQGDGGLLPEGQFSVACEVTSPCGVSDFCTFAVNVVGEAGGPGDGKGSGEDDDLPGDPQDPDEGGPQDPSDDGEDGDESDETPPDGSEDPAENPGAGLDLSVTIDLDRTSLVRGEEVTVTVSAHHLGGAPASGVKLFIDHGQFLAPGVVGGDVTLSRTSVLWLLPPLTAGVAHTEVLGARLSGDFDEGLVERIVLTAIVADDRYGGPDLDRDNNRDHVTLFTGGGPVDELPQASSQARPEMPVQPVAAAPAMCGACGPIGGATLVSGLMGLLFMRLPGRRTGPRPE